MAGPYLAYRVARLHSFAGETGRALDELEQALKVPGPSAHLTALDPAFDPLRNDPRFQRLIAGALHK
jgi:hypothetical protein